MEYLIVKNTENSNIIRAFPGDAGLDIKSNEDCTLNFLERRLISTNLFTVIPYGYVGYVMSRSGLAAKNGVVVFNSPGVIDHGYTGEISVNLMNYDNKPFEIKKGDRIAQLIIQEIKLPKILKVENLPTYIRGSNGHGSTGV